MIRVRKGTRGDLERIVDFQIAMAQETEGIKLDRETVTKGVRAVFKDSSKGTYYIAEEDGKVFGMLLAIPEWSDWRNATVIWIHSLYVVPQGRGRGVFKALYEHLKKKVENSDSLAGLRLYVDKKNKSAQMVYERLGMDKEHYLMYEWLK